MDQGEDREGPAGEIQLKLDERFPKCRFDILIFSAQIGKATGKLRNFIIEPFVAHEQVRGGEHFFSLFVFCGSILCLETNRRTDRKCNVPFHPCAGMRK